MESECERAGGSYRGLLGKHLPQPRLDLIKVTSPSVCLEESGTGGLAVVVGCNPFPVVGVQTSHPEPLQLSESFDFKSALGKIVPSRIGPAGLQQDV